MHYQFFTVRALDSEADAARLNAFLAANPILSLEREFIADGANSYWAYSIAVAAPGEASKETQRKRGSIDYRDVLSPEHFTVYAKLRSLRNGMAEKQGAAPFAIFTNEQLAKLAQLPEPTKEAMASIDGIGEKRLAQYADAFLEVLQASRNA